MSQELAKLRRILPIVNGRKIEELLRVESSSPEKPITQKKKPQVQIKIRRNSISKVKTDKHSTDNSTHPVKETIQQLIEEKYNTIHELLSQPYNEQKFETITSSLTSPKVTKKVLIVTTDQFIPQKRDIIHSRPNTHSGKLYRPSSRNFFQNHAENFGRTSSTPFIPKKASLFDLSGMKFRSKEGQRQPNNRSGAEEVQQNTDQNLKSKLPSKGVNHPIVLPEITTRFEQFMADNPRGKSYSRRLEDKDSFFFREMEKKRNLVLRDNMPPLNQSEYQITPLPSPGSGLVINTKSLQMFRSPNATSNMENVAVKA